MLDDRPITVPRLGLKGFPSEVFSYTEGSDPFSSLFQSGMGQGTV